jgi:hypothetical protein
LRYDARPALALLDKQVRSAPACAASNAACRFCGCVSSEVSAGCSASHGAIAFVCAAVELHLRQSRIQGFGNASSLFQFLPGGGKENRHQHTAGTPITTVRRSPISANSVARLSSGSCDATGWQFHARQRQRLNRYRHRRLWRPAR